MEDDVVRQSIISLRGELKWPPPPIVTSKSELVQPAATKAHGKKELKVVDPYK